MLKHVDMFKYWFYFEELFLTATAETKWCSYLLIRNLLDVIDVFLPSNTDFYVELINNFSNQCHVFLTSLNIDILVV